MLEHIGLVLIGLTPCHPWRATLIRTKYKLHSFILSLLISSILRHEDWKKKLLCINDSLSADCALSKFYSPFKICPVIENMHSTSTDDALLVSITSKCCSLPVNKRKTVKAATGFILSFGY